MSNFRKIELLGWIAPIPILLWVDRGMLEMIYRADDYTAVLMCTHHSFWETINIAQLSIWWRPLANIGYYIDYLVFGTWHGGTFLTHWIVHIANACWAVAIYRRFVPGRASGLVLYWILLFHPAGLQTILMLTQKTDVFGVFFYLAALWCFLERRESDRKIWTAAAVIALALGLGFKEMMITFPAAAWCLYHAQSASRGLPRAGVWKATFPYWIAAGIYWVLRSLKVDIPLSYQELLGDNWLWIQLARTPLIMAESVKAVFGFTGTAIQHPIGNYLLLMGVIIAYILRDRFRSANPALWVIAAAGIAYTPVWTFALVMFPRFAYLPTFLAWIGLAILTRSSPAPLKFARTAMMGVLPIVAWAFYHPEHNRYENRTRNEIHDVIMDFADWLGPREEGDTTKVWLQGLENEHYFSVAMRFAYVPAEYGLNYPMFGFMDFPHYQGFLPDTDFCLEYKENGQEYFKADRGFYAVHVIHLGPNGVCGGPVMPPDMRKFHEGLKEHPEWLKENRFIRYENGEFMEIDPPLPKDVK